MDNRKLPINQLIAKINEAADNDEALNLTVDEVKLAAKEFGGLVMIPVYDMENFPIKSRNRDENTDVNAE
ncbi:hypothetical protein [Psychrobacter sp. AOP7-C1-14]|uniref:hypothetical protein n=1 Tax=Psychrobacter sp. AOP7-C1-14 TaxID=3457640 RepID=UPI003FB6A45B|tara:strand:+ start:611 stop:820 length:210 start_codon:yes stop_codon:yes gene_type:complete